MTNIDKPYIQNRVSEWKKRIADLYALVEAGLAGLNDVRVEKSRHTLMHEELMHKSGVGSEKLPILDIYKKDSLAATFKPVGLWVIGANGRIDILTSKGSYILVDKAEHGTAPQWTVFSPKGKKSGAPFSPETIRGLVGAV
jgi:hypothetical protein